MERNIEEAQRKLATFAGQHEAHIYTWGCKHFMTNGQFIERYEKDVCLAKLKNFDPIYHLTDLETDCEDYYTDPTENNLLVFINSISRKVFNMTSIETCQFIYRKLNERYLKRGVAVLFGRELYSVQSKNVVKVHIPITCHFGTQIQMIILIS